MKYAVGVDLGGTNVRVALVDEEGNIIRSIKEKTSKDGINGFVNQIVSLYNELNIKENIEGLGIGVPGPVDSQGIVSHLPNLGIFDPFDLRIMLESQINVPVFVGNDANVAALAEASVGNGKGYNVVQYLTLSTGIGSGLIINKHMITGHYGFAQEVGAMIVKINGRKTPSKPNGCIEGEASGTALVAKAKELGLNVVHAGQIFEACETNPIAKQLKDEFVVNMATIISSIVSYMEPDIFVLGGGIMQSASYFLDELKDAVDELVYPSLKGKIRIVKAKYDQDCGIIGAAMLVLTKGE